MLRRVPQPPVNPALRATERHDFWAGFIVALVGVAFTVCGARHLTAVDTVNGGTAWETQLIKAYSSAGLQYADHLPPTPPPKGDDPEALDRWARQVEHATAPSWKVRVDTESKAACPT